MCPDRPHWACTRMDCAGGVRPPATSSEDHLEVLSGVSISNSHSARKIHDVLCKQKDPHAHCPPSMIHQPHLFLPPVLCTCWFLTWNIPLPGLLEMSLFCLLICHFLRDTCLLPTTSLLPTCHLFNPSPQGSS